MPFVFVEILVIIFFILFPKTVLWLPMKM
jgi:TRAP-type mannitol/chloroaromatic compound transport system permease large subunit